jgi:hypothetical protein
MPQYTRHFAVCVAWSWNYRQDGHGIRFKPAGAEASVYCPECRKEIASGDRQLVDELFESVLQLPKGHKIDGWQHQFPSLD